MKTYLALGDSMSIDDYTGVDGGGAVRQFHRVLGDGWRLDDRTRDGCTMPGVLTDGTGDVITLTIGGNDLLARREHYLKHGVDEFAAEHRRLLRTVRHHNSESLLIVGDIYAPAQPLSAEEQEGLRQANAAIHASCAEFGAQLAPIHDTFRGHEEEYLCLVIEPTLAGATAIAELFLSAYRASGN